MPGTLTSRITATSNAVFTLQNMFVFDLEKGPLIRMDDPFVGTITFCRIYSGRLESGTGVINSTKDRKERIGRMGDAMRA